MTYRELKNKIKEKLTATSGEFSDHEAMLLLTRVSGLDRAAYLARLGEEAVYDAEALDVMIARRINGEPLAYILGETVFAGCRIFVGPACLVPRADTEFVCEKAAEGLKPGARVADLCTGSGCIAVALAKMAGCAVDAFELSPEALAFAERNARENGAEDRIVFRCADVTADPLTGVYDLIVSNPPYIPTDVIDGLSREVQKEPRMALDGGTDGLAFYRAILSYAPSHLKRDGAIVFEIGYDQGDALGVLAREVGMKCEIFRDYGGNPRVAKLFF